MRQVIKQLFCGVFFVFFLVSGAWATVRIGVVTDTRYDRIDYAGRAVTALDVLSTFKTEQVNLVLHLGNAYEGDFAPDGTSQQKQEDFLADKTIYEPIWESIDTPVYWLIGNLDRLGVGNNFYIENCAYSPDLNFTVDLEGWRFICYFNSDYANETPRLASDETLIWLEDALENARTDGKKIIVCTHCRIDEDLDEYGFSSNANAQRSKINAAVTAGAEVKCVFQGHANINGYNLIDELGYYTFDDARDTGSCAVVEIQDDDSLAIFGYGKQNSYNVTQFYVDGENGNDANNGETKAQAWKTLNHANNTIDNGQTVIIAPSVYRETLDAKSGASGAPKKWIFEPECKISGADMVIDWSQESDANDWYIIENMTKEPIVLFEDGVKLSEGDYTAVAENGTWDWNENILYYSPSDDSPAKHTVEIGQRDRGIQLSGEISYLTIGGGGIEIYGCNEDGVYIQGGDASVTMTDFTSRDNGRSGIWSYFSSSEIILSHFIIQNNNKHGVCLDGISPTIAYGIITRNMGRGIWVKNSSFAKIYNVISVFHRAGIYLENSGGNVELKNIISSYNSNYDFYASENGAKSITHSYIPLSDREWGNTNYESIYSEDPVFVDPDSGDFHLRWNSPCIDAGMSVTGLHDKVDSMDTDKNPIVLPPDIGAYEYVVDSENLTLGDAIIALRAVSGILPPSVYSVDVNKDKKIGLEEAIFICQVLSGAI